MIRVVLTASTMFLSRLIRWATRGRVSHCMLQYPSDLWGGDWVAEATVGGVQIRPAETRCHHVKDEFLCKFEPRFALHSIRAEIGQPFDYPGLAAFVWVILIGRLLGRKVRWPWRNSKAQFCAEFIWRFFIAAKIPGAEARDPETVTPEDVYDFMEERPDYFERLQK